MRKRKDFERKEGVRSAMLVVIAAEGRFTENIYFNSIKKNLCASDVHVEVLHRDTDESSPESVYSQINDFCKEYNIEDDDQLWVVVDKDNWKTKMLASVAKYCAQNDNLNFCVSNPCFELWLILHLEDVNDYDETKLKLISENKKKSKYSDTWTKHRMKELLGHYSESDYDADALMPMVEIAAERAGRLDKCPDDRWPQSLGTRVYLLVNSIVSGKK